MAVDAREEVDASAIRDQQPVKTVWLKAYDFAAIKLVVDHYPVASIRSLHISLIGYRWSKEVVRIAGRDNYLQEIEKDMLLTSF